MKYRLIQGLLHPGQPVLYAASQCRSSSAKQTFFLAAGSNPRPPDCEADVLITMPQRDGGPTSGLLFTQLFYTNNGKQDLKLIILIAF